jgi:hypothetical protein
LCLVQVISTIWIICGTGKAWWTVDWSILIYGIVTNRITKVSHEILETQSNITSAS